MPISKVKPSNSKPAPRTASSAKRTDEPANLSLPKGKIKVATEFDRFSLLLYGEKGIGKTSLIGQFPNHLIFQFDPRRSNVSVRQVPNADDPEPLTWPKFLGYLRLIENRSESSRMAVCLDIAHHAFALCMSHTCAKIGVEHPSQMNDSGKTWKACAQAFQDVLDRIADANCQVIVTAHAKFKEVPLASGTGYEVLAPEVPGQLWTILRAFDNAFYYGYTGNIEVLTNKKGKKERKLSMAQRTLQVRGDDFTWAACGVENTFLDPDGYEVYRYAMPNSASEAYKVLMSGFANKEYGIAEPSADDEENAVEVE